MIQSNLELRVAVKWLKDFKIVLANLLKSELDDLEREIQSMAIQSEIDVIESDIRDYLYRGL
jgi:hypothetical protein